MHISVRTHVSMWLYYGDDGNIMIVQDLHTHVLAYLFDTDTYVKLLVDWMVRQKLRILF